MPSHTNSAEPVEDSKRRATGGKTIEHNPTEIGAARPRLGIPANGTTYRPSDISDTYNSPNSQNRTVGSLIDFLQQRATDQTVDPEPSNVEHVHALPDYPDQSTTLDPSTEVELPTANADHFDHSVPSCMEPAETALVIAATETEIGELQPRHVDFISETWAEILRRAAALPPIWRHIALGHVNKDLEAWHFYNRLEELREYIDERLGNRPPIPDDSR